MKSYLVDTASSLVFFTVIAALSELLIAGMAPGQVLIARLIMIPVMLATSRPYGLWRDWVFARVQPARWISVTLTDIVAFVAFQVPVYITTLVVAGATWAEIGAAVEKASRPVHFKAPQGLRVDVLRRTPDVYEAEKL